MPSDQWFTDEWSRNRKIDHSNPKELRISLIDRNRAFEKLLIDKYHFGSIKRYRQKGVDKIQITGGVGFPGDPKAKELVAKVIKESEDFYGKDNILRGYYFFSHYPAYPSINITLKKGVLWPR